MRDNYSVSGQAGAVGPNTHVHENTFNQIQFGQSIDLLELEKQLIDLRQAIKDSQDPSPQADIALGEIAKAQIAIQEKNQSKLIEHLKSAGQWTLGFAKDIGKDVVVEAIKQSLGSP